MSYGGHPYGGGAYAASDVAEIPDDTDTHLAVEVAFTTGALETPVWVDITPDVRSWDTTRGRGRELERFQPGRATVVLSNLERQYDSANSAGPHAGNLKPMRRMRIRETFSGVTYPVFDGYADRWVLDYPGTGKDATGALVATDGFKIHARTDLRRSVYYLAVLADDPDIYWPLDEALSTAADAALTAANYGSAGADGNGTYVGPPLRMAADPLVVNDPGGSIYVNQRTLGTTLVIKMGVTLDAAGYDLFANAPFVLEAWCVPIIDPPDAALFDFGLWETGTGSDAYMQLAWNETNQQFQFAVANDAAAVSVVSSASGLPYNARYHVVASFENGQPLELWVNGVRTTGDTPSGTFANAAGDDTFLGHGDVEPSNNNWSGNIAHAAIYSGARAQAVDSAWVAAHYAAGTAPWQGDDPGERIGRALDLDEWPADLRDIDDGAVTLQSAELDVTVLEHLQKVAETENGLLFMSARGTIRFIDQGAVAARDPGPDVYGDTTGEVGYSEIKFDDGDSVIRNRATISRLNGAARTDEDTASVAEYGRFQYTLEGLLHDDDDYSAAYAAAIVAAYAEPRRRVTSLTFRARPHGEEADLAPILALELGDVITVRHRPPGGGGIEQVCYVEGLRDSGVPGGQRTRTVILSPAAPADELAGALLTETGDDLLLETGDVLLMED